MVRLTIDKYLEKQEAAVADAVAADSIRLVPRRNPTKEKKINKRPYVNKLGLLEG